MRHHRIIAIGFFLAGLGLSGCGSGGVFPTGAAPTITVQPSDATVPLGSSVTFAVLASGSGSLDYQWYRNGTPITASTSSLLSLSPISLGDEKAEFTVRVANQFGDVVSRVALLTIGARAPDPRDLRFQQVDSPSTMNGYHGNGFPIGYLLPLNGLGFPNAIGIPLAVGAGCQFGGAVMNISDCGWVVDTFAQPNGVQTITTNYQSYRFSSWPSIAAQVSDTHTVITGMDLAPLFDSCALSWATSSDSTTYDISVRVSTLAILGPTIAQDAANGRVTTGISFNNGQISTISYGWSGDRSTVYDATVAYTTKAGGGIAAQALAQAGYIITAIGGNDNDGLLLVGTKVRGDTLARPVMVIPGGSSAQPLLDQGYAIVGVMYDKSGFIATIGER